MLESLFNKVAGLRFVTLLKKPPTPVFSCEICETFKNTYFQKRLRWLLPIFREIFKFLRRASFFKISLPLKLQVTFPEHFLRKYVNMLY